MYNNKFSLFRTTFSIYKIFGSFYYYTL